MSGIKQKNAVLRKRDILEVIVIITLVAILCSCWTVNKELQQEVQNLRQENEQLENDKEDDEEQLNDLTVIKEEVMEVNKNLQESIYELKNEESSQADFELKKRYNDYRDFLLKEMRLIELKEESEKNSDLLVLTPIEESFILFQTRFDDWQEALVKGVPALLYYPDAGAEKVKLHFKMQLPPKQEEEQFPANPEDFELVPDENWTLTCQGPKSTDVQLEKDENNPNYYYMILDEKGLYRFQVTQDNGSEGYFYLKW